MRGEILGFERRRRWSDEEKLGIVMSVGTNETTVTQVAQRHEITRQQVYAWRHEMKKNGLWSPDGGALFLLFDILAYGVTTIADTPTIAAAMAVELRLFNGRTLHFDSSMAAVGLEPVSTGQRRGACVNSIISQVVWPHQFGYGVEHENASVNAAAAPEGLSPLS
jgi:transposase